MGILFVEDGMQALGCTISALEGVRGAGVACEGLCELS